jgi:hypothetical protein
MDNLNTHRHPILRAFYRVHRITVVPTPTYASWLNLIESHLGVMRRFTLNGSDGPTHLVRRRRNSRYLTWRDRRAGSPVGYPPPGLTSSEAYTDQYVARLAQSIEAGVRQAATALPAEQSQARGNLD